jgi:DNA-binding transcriptional MerR regulator
MNNKENKEYLADPNKKETIVERDKRIETQHKRELDEKNKEIEALLEEKDDKAQENRKKENEIIKLKAANKALDKALYSERTQKEAGEFQAKSEGEIISQMAADILMKRCKSGRYGIKCDKH